jgi:predicted dehydrogenase
MKLIQVGIGSFGRGWYDTIKKKYPQFSLAVVDRDPSAAQAVISAGDRFYTSLPEAIAQEQPDFVLNVSPPQAHTAINAIAFEHKLPVLCEKPIAEDYEEAVRIVTRARAEKIPFMIAENYRRMPVMRRAKEILTGGAIGALRSLHCDHYKYLYTEKPYFLQMKDPYLVDVVVHLLDLFRFLSSREGCTIYARSYRPQGSWHPGNLALSLSMDMEDGIRATLAGSLITRGPQTAWAGDWRIEGADGSLAIRGNSLSLYQGERLELVEDLSEATAPGCLDDFLYALDSGDEPETSGTDYLRTQALVHFSQISSQAGGAVQVILP